MKKQLLILACCLLQCAVGLAQGWGQQSKVITDSMYSETLKAWRAYNVFVPRSFEQDKDRQYPVLYLLHGMWGTNKDWDGRGHVKDVMDQLVASGEACEMIIVMPNAGGVVGKEWNGYFNMKGWPYEDFFFNELMPKVEKQYRVIGDKQHRAVAGLSMGGGGSTSYAERHTDKFGACYAMSALMELPQYTPEQERNTDLESMEGQLYLTVRQLGCTKYVREASDDVKQQLRTVNWFVDCGDDDFLLDRNLEFFQAMREAHIPCQLRVRDGGHTWEYWHSALYTCLPFVTRCFGK